MVRAHPRVCGADVFAVVFRDCGLGSSPRVRGRRPKRAPALASLGAHPRVCGADMRAAADWLRDKGSSPRVRGRLLRLLHLRHKLGLIPACAGQTHCLAHLPFLAGAHPRVCGADLRIHRRGGGYLGSSPRVRGRRPRLLGLQRHRGLIPACAGQTRCVVCERILKWAHPRVCGADRRLRRGHPRPLGLIPACAGQTGSQLRASSPRRAHPRVCGADSLTA